MGLLFFMYFWLPIVGFFLKSIPRFFKSKDVVFKCAFAVLLVNFFVFIFYSSVSSYEMLIFTAGLYVLGMNNKGDLGQIKMQE